MIVSSLAPVLQSVGSLEQTRRLLALVGENRSVTCSGVTPAARAPVLLSILKGCGSPVLWITPSNDAAERLLQDLALYSEEAVHFPEREDDGAAVDPVRLEAVEKVRSGAARLVVVSVRSLLQKTVDPFHLDKGRVILRRGDRTDLEILLELLVQEGYRRTGMVERRGEFSVRGDILDLYPVTGDPVRMELFGDEIESMRRFDRDTQRSVEEIAQVMVLPAREGQSTSRLTDFLPRGTVACLEEPAQLRLHAMEWAHEGWGGHWGDFLALLTPMRTVFFTAWEDAEQRAARQETESLEFPFEQQRVFPDRVEGMMGRLPEWLREGRRVVLVSRQKPRLSELLQENNLPESPRLEPGKVLLASGIGTEGFRLDTGDGWLELLTDREMMGAIRRRHTTRRAERGSLMRLEELAPGDLIVHLQHGIGIYKGVRSLDIQGNARDFLHLEYAKGDSLYVPVEQLDLVQKYQGLEDKVPRLSRMGGQEWSRSRKKVREDAARLAEELLRLYAQRELSQGHGYPPDTPWQVEMEEAFPFQETEDQLRVIQEVKADMERPRPMDRLVCGDVGYGKTEVAVRAAFKAASEGRQVAVLVPTTILAHQHHQTFSERLAPFPVQIEVLSRFRPPAEIRKAVEDLGKGAVDIVIGTHRLLSKDIKFKNLGLLVVDEEHRFGVKQKERIKQLRQSVDILTLTATPIPRTLNMALMSIRDMSVIETPPEDRVPIKTYLFESHPDILRGAITRELSREGQVYFVHNRVEGIERLAQDLRRMVPSARVTVAHGQMGEQELEKVMMEFLEQEHDILVCTTIIESGIDIPNVNTIIVNNAHHFGLAQLYQMRGRVGRSARQAYCYLLVPPQRMLTPEAEKRLETIRDFTHLGAGFQIALRDLEIRGAGDILGAEQSGSIAAVGFDLYCQMLRDAVRALQGEKVAVEVEERDAVVEIPIPASLPEEYVPDSQQKVALYKKIAAARRAEDLEAIREELRDRFGPLPEEARNLLDLMNLRQRARELLIPSIRVKEGRLTVLIPFYRDLTLKERHKLWQATGWKPLEEQKALVFTGLYGVAAGSQQYPPPGELLEKIRGVLDRLRRWQEKPGD
ncbi:MAG: transcription-repair coupling factor [Armatimonadetes bacterium]|nr:transcription-repair coupling factor [Armatimonadota bacterium]